MLVETDVSNNQNELLASLKRIDISVPARTGGRATAHTETYTLCHLVATLATADRLDFPISIRRTDRPDAVVRAGDGEIGIEITEAIPKQFASLCAFAEREFPDAWLPVAHFPRDALALSADQMRELLRQDSISGDGWVGDRPEHEWAHFMKGVVDIKLAKLAQPAFSKYGQNWLSVYDNLPLPNVHLGKAIEILRPLLSECWSRDPAFHTLFFEHGPVIAEITASASEHMLLNDLWPTV